MSGRTRTTGGILQVPVMMDIQSLTHQDFTGLTKEQKKKAIEQLKLVMKMVDPKGKVPMGSDIAYIPEKKIACIDLTSYYEDDEHPEYKDYEDRLPLFRETIEDLKEKKSAHRKSYKRDVKRMKTKEELENYLSDYNSIENHLGQLIYGYELAAKFHGSLFYDRYSDHYFN